MADLHDLIDRHFQRETDMQPELNTELLDKTLDKIQTLQAYEAEGVDVGEFHTQITWGRRDECGTTACFAGWAVQLAGDQVTTVTGAQYGHLVVIDEHGRQRGIGERAQQLLGLTDTERGHLFGSIDGNVAAEVARIKAGHYR